MTARLWIVIMLAMATVVAGSFAPRMRAIAAAVEPTPLRDMVILDHAGLNLVDPVNGGVGWRHGSSSGLSGVVTADNGVIFASFASTDGRVTEVYAIAADSTAPEMIERLPGRFVVEGIAPSGDRLYLVEFALLSPEGMIRTPTAVRDLLLPAPLQVSAQPPAARRDAGRGLLSVDGRQWFRLQPAKSDDNADPPAFELVVVTFGSGSSPVETAIPLPSASGYSSLLLAPDGGRAYVIDFFSESVFDIDLKRRTVAPAVEFGRHRVKRSPCAAALSPQGDRLYMLQTPPSVGVGDAVLVFDTTTWALEGRFFPGHKLYCLTASPDGDRLYASTMAEPASRDDPQLVTIDAQTGDALQQAPLKFGECCAFVVAAVASREATLPAL